MPSQDGITIVTLFRALEDFPRLNLLPAERKALDEAPSIRDYLSEHRDLRFKVESLFLDDGLRRALGDNFDALARLVGVTRLDAFRAAQRRWAAQAPASSVPAASAQPATAVGHIPQPVLEGPLDPMAARIAKIRSDLEPFFHYLEDPSTLNPHLVTAEEVQALRNDFDDWTPVLKKESTLRFRLIAALAQPEVQARLGDKTDDVIRTMLWRCLDSFQAKPLVKLGQLSSDDNVIADHVLFTVIVEDKPALSGIYVTKEGRRISSYLAENPRLRPLVLSTLLHPYTLSTYALVIGLKTFYGLMQEVLGPSEGPYA